MLTKKQVDEVREHLEKAQNPLFFFDNDPDGLCSFLLLQRFIGRGKGVSIKSKPDLSVDYFRKVQELKADYIFILDKPLVSEEFFKEAEENNIPTVWIDHHVIDTAKISKFVHYYNPVLNKPKTEEPVTVLCYQITGKKDDIWIAAAGAISDKFVPKFYDEFEKNYNDLSIKSRDAFDIVYKSRLGKIIRIFSFGLKDRTTNVVAMLKFLMKVKTPYEVLEENNHNYEMHKRFNQVMLIYDRLLQKAILLGKSKGEMLFFKYGGDLSISSELSNELIHLFPKKVIVVIYPRGSKANVSIRGKNARKILLEAIKNLEGATGGGHEKAVGGKINIQDLNKFKENIEKYFK